MVYLTQSNSTFSNHTCNHSSGRWSGTRWCGSKTARSSRRSWGATNNDQLPDCPVLPRFALSLALSPAGARETRSLGKVSGSVTVLAACGLLAIAIVEDEQLFSREDDPHSSSSSLPCTATWARHIASISLCGTYGRDAFNDAHPPCCNIHCGPCANAASIAAPRRMAWDPTMSTHSLS